MTELDHRRFIKGAFAEVHGWKFSKSALAKIEDERCRWLWGYCPLKIEEGNRYFCRYHYEEGEHAIPKNNYYGGAASVEAIKEFRVKHNLALEALRKRLALGAIILTTSFETLLQHPNAIMISQRYARYYLRHKTVRFFPETEG